MNVQPLRRSATPRTPPPNPPAPPEAGFSGICVALIALAPHQLPLTELSSGLLLTPAKTLLGGVWWKTQLDFNQKVKV